MPLVCIMYVWYVCVYVSCVRMRCVCSCMYVCYVCTNVMRVRYLRYMCMFHDRDAVYVCSLCMYVRCVCNAMLCVVCICVMCVLWMSAFLCMYVCTRARTHAMLLYDGMLCNVCM